MGSPTSSVDDLIGNLAEVTKEIIELSKHHGISADQQDRIRTIHCDLDMAIQASSQRVSTVGEITNVPLFSTGDLANTVKRITSFEEALRAVMISTDVPLHWNTIYSRVLALTQENLSPVDTLPQRGHPSMARWQYRLSWQMQQLRLEGIVKSVGDGYWMRVDPDAPIHQPALFD